MTVLAHWHHGYCRQNSAQVIDSAVIYACTAFGTYHLWLGCVFPLGYSSAPVTGDCPVTTDLIMRVNVRTTTTTTTTSSTTTAAATDHVAMLLLRR